MTGGIAHKGITLSMQHNIKRRGGGGRWAGRRGGVGGYRGWLRVTSDITSDILVFSLLQVTVRLKEMFAIFIQ